MIGRTVTIAIGWMIAFSLSNFSAFAANDDQSQSKQQTLRLFGKDIKVNEGNVNEDVHTSPAQSHDLQSRKGKRPSRQEELSSPTAPKRQKEYTEKDAERLNFKYDASHPLSLDELHAMPRFDRARHSDPFARRIVFVGGHKDKDGIPIVRQKDETNIAFIDRTLKLKRENMMKRERAFREEQKDALDDSNRGVSDTRTASSRRTPISLALTGAQLRNKRAQQAGDQVMMLKDKQGNMRPDPKGRTGDEYLRQRRLQRAEAQARYRQRRKENKVNSRSKG